MFGYAELCMLGDSLGNSRPLDCDTASRLEVSQEAELLIELSATDGPEITVTESVITDKISL